MQNKARVFVIQAPARMDTNTGNWVEKYDLSAAEYFGTIIRVLQYGNIPNNPEPTLFRLNSVMFNNLIRPFDYDLDKVLLLGDPVAMAQAISLLERNRPKDKKIQVLKWDRRASEYYVYPIG